MEKISLIFLIVFTLGISMRCAYAHRENVIRMPGNGGAAAPTTATNDSPIILKPVEQWFDTLESAKEIQTKLHFYIQDILLGPNKTVYKVAEAEITPISPTTFGEVSIIDDLLTVGPEYDSGVVGRAQGTIGFADLHDTALQINLNFHITEGLYRGSTITVSGRNPILESDRELAIVGGTGVFRMARGIAVTNTYSYDPENMYGILEYTLYIVHY